MRVVRLSEAKEDPAEDAVLWEIRSDEGSELDTFIVGETPDGFEEHTEFVPSQLDQAESLVATVETGDQTGSGISFKLSDLEPGQVFASTSQGRKENVDIQTFDERAEESCRR